MTFAFVWRIIIIDKNQTGGETIDKAKKIIKIVAIIIAVAAAVVGIAFAVKKIIDKKKAAADEPENYVSCSCCDTCAPAAN